MDIENHEALLLQQQLHHLQEGRIFLILRSSLLLIRSTVILDITFPSLKSTYK